MHIMCSSEHLFQIEYSPPNSHGNAGHRIIYLDTCHKKRKCGMVMTCHIQHFSEKKVTFLFKVSWFPFFFLWFWTQQIWWTKNKKILKHYTLNTKCTQFKAFYTWFSILSLTTISKVEESPCLWIHVSNWKQIVLLLLPRWRVRLTELGYWMP